MAEGKISTKEMYVHNPLNPLDQANAVGVLWMIRRSRCLSTFHRRLQFIGTEIRAEKLDKYDPGNAQALSLFYGKVKLLGCRTTLGTCDTG